MGILNFLKKNPPQKTSAEIAFERLRFTIEHNATTLPENIIDEIKDSIMQTIKKYRHLAAENIDVKDISHGNFEMFEININLPPQP